MLVCDSYRFAFVHVHRTGGTSISEMCKRLLPNTRQKLSQHTHFGSTALDLDAVNGYNVYAFVRNPWDRLYSWYSLFAEYNPRKDQESFSLEEFLLDYSRIARNYGLDSDFRFNQLDYLRDHHGKLIPQFVGRYEAFAQDAVRMFETLGISVDHVSWLNATTHPCFRSEYSVAAKEFVADRCSADIKYWGYQFGPPGDDVTN